MQPTSTRTAPPTSAADLARRTALGVLASVVLSLVVLAAATASGLDLGASGPTSPSAALPVVVPAVVAGAGAAVAYAALDRLGGRPVRNFLALSAVVFGLMLLPVVAVAPTMGVTSLEQVVLVVLHVTVAATLVAAVVGAERP